MSDKLKAALLHMTEQTETMEDTKAVYMAGYIDGMRKGGEIMAALAEKPESGNISAEPR